MKGCFYFSVTISQQPKILYTVDGNYSEFFLTGKIRSVQLSAVKYFIAVHMFIYFAIIDKFLVVI